MTMDFKMDRRSALKAGAALAAACALPAAAQGKPTLRFAAVFSDKDIRADMVRKLAADVAADYTIEPFFNASMFKQGTELVALQRDNLEIGNIAPQEHLQADPVLDAAHLGLPVPRRQPPGGLLVERPGRAVQEGGRGAGEGQDPRAHVLRHPAGGPEAQEKDQYAHRHGRHQLRMPPGRCLATPRRSLGANPTPMAFAETYTGLQTGAVDGQDNPLPNVNAMKFYEVMTQIVLTGHPDWIRLAVDEPEELELDVASAAESVSVLGRQGGGLEHRRAPEARGGAG
jgi:hypothetical protein